MNFMWILFWITAVWLIAGLPWLEKKAWEEFAYRTGMRYEARTLLGFIPQRGRVTGQYRNHHITLDTYTKKVYITTSLIMRVVLLPTPNTQFSAGRGGLKSNLSERLGIDNFTLLQERQQLRFEIKPRFSYFAGVIRDADFLETLIHELCSVAAALEEPAHHSSSAKAKKAAPFKWSKEMYPFEIRGITISDDIQELTFRGINSRNHKRFALNAKATDATVQQLVRDIPTQTHITFYDKAYPSPSDPGAYVTFRRTHNGYMIKRGNHGWGSKWMPMDGEKLEAYLLRCSDNHRIGAERFELMSVQYQIEAAKE